MNKLIETHDELLERKRELDNEREALKKKLREARSALRHAKDAPLTESETAQIRKRVESLYAYAKSIDEGIVEFRVRKQKEPLDGNLLVEMEDTMNMRYRHDPGGIYITFIVYRTAVYKLICEILGESDACYDNKPGCKCGKYTWTLRDEEAMSDCSDTSDD
jgi:hypothetical protein